MKENNFDENPWFTETHLLKFCRARQFDFEKVKIMWTDYMQYRESYKINTIMTDDAHELT